MRDARTVFRNCVENFFGRLETRWGNSIKMGVRCMELVLDCNQWQMLVGFAIMTDAVMTGNCRNLISVANVTLLRFHLAT
jgi:hypothetical protein